MEVLIELAEREYNKITIQTLPKRKKTKFIYPKYNLPQPQISNHENLQVETKKFPLIKEQKFLLSRKFKKPRKVSPVVTTPSIHEETPSQQIYNSSDFLSPEYFEKQNIVSNRFDLQRGYKKKPKFIIPSKSSSSSSRTSNFIATEYSQYIDSDSTLNDTESQQILTKVYSGIQNQITQNYRKKKLLCPVKPKIERLSLTDPSNNKQKEYTILPEIDVFNWKVDYCLNNLFNERYLNDDDVPTTREHLNWGLSKCREAIEKAFAKLGFLPEE